MRAKRRRMLICYYLPGVIAGIRIAFTLVCFMWNPLLLPLRFFQIFLLLSYSVHLFMYFKLYDDGIPLITIIAPDLIHGILIFIFVEVIPLLSLGVFLIADILFLIAKGLKASYFPFDIDGDYDDSLEDEELD